MLFNALLMGTFSSTGITPENSHKTKPCVTSINGSNHDGLKLIVVCVMVRQLHGLTACQGPGKATTCHLHGQLLRRALPANPKTQQFLELVWRGCWGEVKACEIYLSFWGITQRTVQVKCLNTPTHLCFHYFQQGDYAFARVCQSVYLSICLWVR